VTITAYALARNPSSTSTATTCVTRRTVPDLGNIFKDRNFDGSYVAAVDEFVPLAVNNASRVPRRGATCCC